VGGEKMREGKSGRLKKKEQDMKLRGPRQKGGT